MTDLQDVLAKTGATQRQLNHWTNAGWLRPVGRGGQGNPRSWPPLELEVAALTVRLLVVGFYAQAAIEIARAAIEGGLGSTEQRVVVELASGINMVVHA